MNCHCNCHVVIYSVVPDGCPDCGSWHEPVAEKHIPITVDNMQAFVTEVMMHTDGPFNSVVIRYRALPPGPATAGMQQIGVQVATTLELLNSNYVGAVEEANHLAAQHFDKMFREHGMPKWVRERLVAHHDQETPPVQGGHAILTVPGPHHVSWSSSWGQAVGGDTVVRDLRRWLPALDAMVNCPARASWGCGDCLYSSKVCEHAAPELERCANTATVQRMIVHLNDNHRWSREQIADWLETLDVDLTFPTEPPPEPPRLPRKDVSVYIDEIKKYAEKHLIQKVHDQGHEGSSVGYAIAPGLIAYDEAKALYQQAQQVDPWPGGFVKHHMLKPDPMQKALDAKKNPSHTHFAVNPTKKSPFKK